MNFENDDRELVENLFRPVAMPSGFKRKKPTAFRFQPYSRKMRRRLDLYTSIVYDLWVELEWNPEIESFNERVEKIPIAGCDGKIFYWAPRMVSMSIKKTICVHALQVEDPENSESFNFERDGFLRDWADANCLQLKIWTPEEIRRNPIELENRKQMYAFLSNPETVVSADLKETVLLILRRYRKTTINDLLQTIGEENADSALQVIAELQMDKILFSDIEKFPFGWTTEISCYEFA